MSRRVLYGVLNWGLGHASRSSVVIRALEEAGFEPLLASDGVAGEWLQEEFPHLEYRELPSYEVRYSKSSRQWPSLVSGLPRIAKAASAERRILRIWAEELKPAGIISDNRLGFSHPDYPSAYISHQLSPKAGSLTRMAAASHRSYYRQFSELWIPDDQNRSLSGSLSTGLGKKRFIGPLSTLERRPTDGNKVLIILSGPEPQRSILERRLFEQADALPDSTVLVRGINGACPDRYHQKFKVYDRLGRMDLSALIAQSTLVISRSGYSSLMDYYYLGKRALLVPTPGQSEQEYLAKRHAKKKGYMAVKQDDLLLSAQLEQALALPFPEPQDFALPEDLFKIFSK
ncbi:glycosyltransferase [Croceimicrobium sp.]|uniref:glycosyltransferase n=1 Tax=Croceimicrobium sp. TaxID=2828340 RepID=UPI003BAD0B70